MTTTDKRHRSEKRQPINRLVAPDTARLLKSLAANLGISEGRVLDRAVAALAVAESFGPEHLNIHRHEICPHIPTCDGDCESALTLDKLVPSDANSVVRQFNQWKPTPPKTFTAPELLAMTDDELDNTGAGE